MKTKKVIYKIHDFFDKPSNIWAYFVQGIIFLLILVSVSITTIEFFNPGLYKKLELDFLVINNVALVAFTLEYILRLASSPKKLDFIRKPMNLVDFLAIAPNYIEFILPLFVNPTELSILRLIRLLRLSRLIRLLKVFEYRRFMDKVFVFQETILEAIFPVLVIFAFLKSIIWLLETRQLWFSPPDLSNLFATIGFALGIILSQKIGVSYDKFVNIEETLIKIYGNLQSLSSIFDRAKFPEGKIAIANWTSIFLYLLENPQAENSIIRAENEHLYKTISKIEDEPADLSILYGDIVKDAALCLSKKLRLTPKAYDILLHQATILYLVLIAMFVPGLVGLASVLIATYLLYGMYELTEDLDSILGGSHNLINVNMTEIRLLTNITK